MLIQRDSKTRCWAFLLICALAGHVTAQEACMPIESPDDRLKCYDQWAADQSNKSDGHAAKSEEPASAAPASPWSVRAEKSAMKDTENVYASVISDNPVTCTKFGTPAPITLLLRCSESRTVVMIGGNCHVASGFDNYGLVTYRRDKEKAQKRTFSASTDSAVLGLWDGAADAVPFILEMFGKEQLLVRFTPFGMSPIEATFDIRGTEAAVADLRKACGW